MHYRALGKSGIAVSTIALGTMDFGGVTPEAEAFAIMDAYLEADGNFIDTSNLYNSGLSEEIIGRWLESRSTEVTERVVLATKGRFSPDPDVNAVGSSRRALRRDLDGSLRRLGRDHVDLYQLHAWDPITPVEETLSFLDGALRAGKIEYIGVSNFLGWQLSHFIDTAKAMGISLPLTNQSQYSLLSREVEYEVVPAALYNGVGILPWSPLAGGFLAGAYNRGAAPAEGTRAKDDNPLYQWVSNEYASSDRNWATIDTVVDLAAQLATTPTAVALRWLIDQPGVIAPIMGARNLNQLKGNLAAAELKLTTEMHQILTDVSQPQPATYPYGKFSQAQNERRLDGIDELSTLVGAGSDKPTG